MIRKQIIPTSQFDVKCPYNITPIGISVHNTGNTASAENENKNLSWTRDERSFHYVTDEYGTIQNVEDNRNTWANSDYNKGWKSKNYLNWEISELNYEKSEKMAIKDIAQVLYIKNWDTSVIKNHSTFDPTSGCPRKTLPHWNRFIAEIDSELNRLKNNHSKKYYRVQVGAYSTLANAEKMKKDLMAKGIDSFIKTVNGLHKVQVGAYSVKSNADTMKEKLKSLGIDSFIAHN